MSQAAADPPFPPARALAGWWRELLPARPLRIWFGQLLFHRLEVLVAVERTVPLDALQKLLVNAVDRGTSWPALDPAVLTRWLHLTAAEGLIRAGPGGWEATEAGRAAITSGTFPRRRQERRTFDFLDNASLGRPPAFLLPCRPLLAVAAPDGWRFDPQLIAACVAQPEEWKRLHHFPVDVRDVVDWTATSTDWRAVPLARTERFVGLLTETAEGVTAFVVRPETWGLERDPPALVLENDWRDTLPDFAPEVPREQWRGAWQSWCQAHSIAVEEGTAECARDGMRLVVRVTPAALDRLRSARGDPLRNDAWLLAGTGRCRELLPFEVTA
jgi:hypothetical protein